MSCLTRKLQQKLTRYLQLNRISFVANDPERIRDELVNKGLCPSDVTSDQFRAILQQAASTEGMFAAQLIAEMPVKINIEAP
jgi:hypothetical protein